MSMDLNEIRAARMYIFGLEAIDRIMANCHMSRQEVLHSIALYKAEHRDTHPECEHCRMRSGDRPCVWPKGGVRAVNSNKRKSGGAYRLRKRSVSLHAKAGKDRSKAKRKRVKK